MKALVGAFNQEKALVAFSVIVQPVVEPMDRFTALVLPPYHCKLSLMLSCVQTMQTGSGSGSSPKVAGSGSQSGESSISGAVSGPSTETQARDDSGHYSAGAGARARY